MARLGAKNPIEQSKSMEILDNENFAQEIDGISSGDFEARRRRRRSRRY